MSVKNLTNTTWKLPNKFSNSTKTYAVSVWFTTESGKTYTSLWYSEGVLKYETDYNSQFYTTVYSNGVWVDSDYKTIKFIAGAPGDDSGLTATRLIEWLDANAELQKVTHLIGSTWNLLSEWSVPSEYGIFQYPEDAVTLKDDTTSYISGLRLGYRWTKFSNGTLTWQGSEDSIFAYGKLPIDDKLYMGGWKQLEPDSSYSITFNNTINSDNESLMIEWLYANAYMTQLPMELPTPSEPVHIYEYDFSENNLPEGTWNITVVLSAEGYKDSVPSLPVKYHVEETKYLLSGKYIFHDTLTTYENSGYGIGYANPVGFVSNGETYYRISTTPKGYVNNEYSSLEYCDLFASTKLTVNRSTTGWVNDNYKTIEFNGTWVVDKEFYDWFSANATEYVEPALEAGLYDADDNLVASWDTLVSTYGMDVEKDYTSVTYETDTSSLYSVLTNNSKLSQSSKLVVSSNLSRLGNFACSYCTSLTNVVVPKSLTNIGSHIFYGCSSLVETNILDNLTTIKSSLFANCTSLVTVSIPQCITSIDAFAFKGCSSLKNVHISDYVTSIGTAVFSECIALENLTIPNSVKNIGSYAFSGCKSLTSITIPNSVTSIDHGAFYDCPSLTNIKIPDSVTSIDSYTFEDCTALTSIEIPDSVTSIGQQSFYNCKLLTSLIFEGTVAQWNAITFGNRWNANVPATYVTCTDGTVAI